MSDILKHQDQKYNKNILYYYIYIIYFDLFNIIKNKIEKIKILKYKNLTEYKDLITYYNNFIKKYNLYIYGIKYEIFTIDLFKKKNINNIILIPEISPFKVSHDIYNNIIKTKIKSYLIKGFIGFIVYRKTKTQENTKIYIFSNIKHKNNNYYVYNIRELLNFIAPQLLVEIDILIKTDLNDIIDENTYMGYMITLSCNKTNYNKNDFLDRLYFYNDYINSELYINIYFKIQQYKKNTTKFNFMSINNDIFDKFKYISYNLEYNNNFNDPGIIIKNNNIYIVSNNIIKTKFNNNFNINKNLNIDIILKYKNVLFNYTTEFRDLLYSLDSSLYILKHTEKLYIIDIYKTNTYLENTEFYKIINKDYILKKNNIIFKKNISKSLEMLLKIDTNVINWFDFIKISDKVYENTNLYDWFLINYKKYLLKNIQESEQISKSFKYLSLFDLFVLIFGNIDFSNFIIYFNKNYKIKNQSIIKNSNEFKNNFKYDNFIDIIKIFLYLYGLK